VLVTGGAGFIGSHVVDKLRAAGHEPRIFDLRPSPHHAPGEVDTHIGDLLSVDDLREAMRDCDAVAHLAASADVGIVAEEPVEAESLNSRGTLNVLEAARHSGIDRVVYASTIWIYSDGCGTQVDEETTVGLPSHLYTATKLAGEMYCKSYSELYDVEFTILRFGIPYGPRARPAAVIPAFVRKALGGEPLTIAGKGTQSRRFVYVEDLAQGVTDALAPVAANRVYNLVSNRDVSIKEIAHTVRELVGDVDVVHTEARTADFGGVVVCGKRASRELGWQASTPFEEGVRRYIDWYRTNNGNGTHAAPAPVAVAVAADADERDTAEHAAVAPVRPLRSRSSALAGVTRVALPTGLFVGVLAMMAAYLVAVHRVGMGWDDARTVGITIIVGLGLYLASRLNIDAVWKGAILLLCWAVAGAYLIATLVPWTRSLFDLSKPDVVSVLLGVAGAGFGIALMASALRLVRARRAVERESEA
jgi:UDP-glucose 4-epimerase